MESTSPLPGIELLSIGDELLNGDIFDTNQAWLAIQLRSKGFTCQQFHTIGDDHAQIAKAFQNSISRSDIIIATGGLGPTGDDLTMEGLAHGLGIELEYRAEVMEQMAERLKRPLETFSHSNKKQANLPCGAIVLQNHWGTAPAVQLTAADGTEIFLLPGVPNEMKNLFKKWILPFLEKTCPSRPQLATRYIHTIGLSESRIGELFNEWMGPKKNPSAGTRVQDGFVTIRIKAQATGSATAEELLDPFFNKACDLLGKHVFGFEEETLAETTARALLAKKLTVSIAESCTAGLITAALGEVAGISEALLESSIVYSNEAKIRTCRVDSETLNTFGAVSEEVASELALGIRNRTGSDIGLSVTGIAGPDGGTPEKPVGLVYFGISTKDETIAVKKIFSGYERNIVRDRATKHGLDLIRCAAMKLS